MDGVRQDLAVQPVSAGYSNELHVLRKMGIREYKKNGVRNYSQYNFITTRKERTCYTVMRRGGGFEMVEIHHTTPTCHGLHRNNGAKYCTQNNRIFG